MFLIERLLLLLLLLLIQDFVRTSVVIHHVASCARSHTCTVSQGEKVYPTISRGLKFNNVAMHRLTNAKTTLITYMRHCFSLMTTKSYKCKYIICHFAHSYHVSALKDLDENSSSQQLGRLSF